ARGARGPPGDLFDSLVQLESGEGIARNPFTNAGALVTAELIRSHAEQPEAALLAFLRAGSGNPDVGTSEAIASSERDSGHRNIALANFIRSYGNLLNEADAVLDFYYLQCALEMDCVDIARSMHFLDRKRGV